MLQRQASSSNHRPLPHTRPPKCSKPPLGRGTIQPPESTTTAVHQPMTSLNSESSSAPPCIHHCCLHAPPPPPRPPRTLREPQAIHRAPPRRTPHHLAAAPPAAHSDAPKAVMKEHKHNSNELRKSMQTNSNNANYYRIKLKQCNATRTR